MNKVFKKITACTLVGAIVAGSFGSYNQVNAKEADTGRKTKILRDISSETSYIVDCKNRFVYDKISKEYLQETEKEEYLQGNNLVSVELTETELKEIQKTGAVIEEDICVTGSGNKATKQTKADKDKKVNKNTKKDKKRELPWNVESLGVTEETQTSEDSSESNGTQEKVKVAILDSGIDFSENINVVERKNFMDDEVSPLYEDNTGHGTAIAGIIASSGEDGMVKGVNPNVEIYSARILDTDNKAPISRVVESIYWAIEEDVDIINISFGTTANSEILHNAIKDATDAGILVFAASGNQGEDEGSTVEYPAAYEEVVAVGATNPDGKVADMTSTGEELDIVAPGINIHSVGWLDMEVTCSGTSMAVPHAVGAASLLWQMDLNKSADFIKGLLEASAKNVEEDGEEYSFIDVEYAKEIYDEYCEKYSATADVEEINEIYENDSEVETYDEAVTGSWAKDNHIQLVEVAYNSTSYYLESWELNRIKYGAREIDNQFPSNYGEEDSSSFMHGYGNYVSNYRFLTYASKFIEKNGVAALMKDTYTVDGARVAAIKNRINNFEWPNYADTKHEKALIVFGFALHTAADAYAHKAYGLQNGIYVNINHNKENSSVDADNYNYFRGRYDGALIMNYLAMQRYFGSNGYGTYKQFVHQYYDSYKLHKLFSYSKVTTDSYGGSISENKAFLKSVSYGD